MQPPWPAGFARVPDAAWTRKEVDALARGYDQVDRHGWYANLDPTVAQLAALLEDGDVVIDHSGGTGILVQRLLRAVGDLRFGVVIADASAKFLRLALEKFRDEPRVALRLLEVTQGRVQPLESAMPELAGQAKAVTCTNAIHLYPDVAAAAASWRAMLQPGGQVLIQSGNIGRDPGPAKVTRAWIIDDTVAALQDAAARIVREDPRYARFRPVLADAARMAAHADVRRRYFLPTRPVRDYVGVLKTAGFQVGEVVRRPVAARTQDWFDFLKVYHDGVLGWVGGVDKVEGKPPSPQDVEARLEVLHRALDDVLGGQDSFQAEWTYITATKPD